MKLDIIQEEDVPLCGICSPLTSMNALPLPPFPVPICPIVLEVRVHIHLSTFVSIVGCSKEDVIVPQGVSQMQPIHVLRGLYSWTKKLADQEGVVKMKRNFSYVMTTLI
ncbi:hypothetical protein TNCV_4938811 [Trichonephila clavipes]|nr:hypothetical protein TNCV_4938811 [Trichonephila clavipes]